MINRDFAYLMLVTVGTTSIVWIVVTMLTSPEPMEKLIAFYRRVRPEGPGWNDIAARADLAESHAQGRLAATVCELDTRMRVDLRFLVYIGKLIFKEAAVQQRYICSSRLWQGCLSRGTFARRDDHGGAPILNMPKNPSSESLVFAVDLGGTHLRVALIDDGGRILKQLKQETPKGDSALCIVNALVNAAQQWESDVARVAASIMVPGAVDSEKAVSCVRRTFLLSQLRIKSRVGTTTRLACLSRERRERCCGR